MLIRSYIIRISRYIALCTALILFQSPGDALGQSDPSTPCDRVVSDAETMFFNASFEQAIEALTWCLSDGSLTAPQQIQAYELLARIRFANQSRALSAEALDQLFKLNPAFAFDTSLPPPFLEFAETIREFHDAEEVLDEQLVASPQIPEEKKTNAKRWLLISGSGLFAITAVAIMSSGRQNFPETFPPAPGPPSSN